MQGNEVAAADGLFVLTLPQWLTVVALASVMLGALSGLLALFTNYKENGKVTRFGRLAAVGILLSASLSVIARIVQDRYDAARADKAADAESKRQTDERERFAQQMATLDGLQGQMTYSLNEQAAQQVLQQETIDKAEAALRETQALSNQEEGNTQRLVLAMWNDANRVTSGSIVAETQTDCNVRGDFQAPPLLPLGATAYLSLRTKDLQGPFLQPSHQQFSQSSAGDRVSQRNTYTTFTGVDSDFNAFKNWSGGFVQFQVRYKRLGIAKLFQDAAAPSNEIQFLYNVKDPQWGIISTLPCRTLFRLFVNDRLVAQDYGQLFELGGNRTDAGDLVANFWEIPVFEDAIPRLPRFERRRRGHPRVQ